MDFHLDLDSSTEILNDPPQTRPKTPIRMTYEAEVKIFRSKYGGIEDVRKSLGFSRRKMCQLLMVDPSAWTRWMRDDSRVPPHIYRALEWYLALEKKLVNEPDLATILLKGRPQVGEALVELRAEVDNQAKVIKRLRLSLIWGSAALFVVGLALIIRGV